MSNLIRSTTRLALHIIRSYIPEPPAAKPCMVIDATCGNGHDTLALARMLWSSGTDSTEHHLLAFDVQQTAIEATRSILSENGFEPLLEDGRIQLIQDGHEHMAGHCNSQADVIVFNLGYLPGGDKQLTTIPGTTLDAVKAGLAILARDGLICITMYSGHPAGAQEKAELLRFAEALDSSTFHTSYISMPNQPAAPPEILLITRKR